MGQIISEKIPYSGPTLTQQTTPIGAIIPFMGKTAPSGYLACDGGVYNISQYPLLAGFFEAQFGSINYFGGNGSTTFAVPNLSGEFLRGAGTNAHANQGSGASVGTHQDGTEHMHGRTWINDSNTVGNIGFYAGTGTTHSIKVDSSIKANQTTRFIEIQSNPGETNSSYYTARPTNTSVLYIIKAKSDRLDKITFAEVDDETISESSVWSSSKTASLLKDYSLEEQATGRRWIDGKMIYQKTVTGNLVIGDVGVSLGVRVETPIKAEGWLNGYRKDGVLCVINLNSSYVYYYEEGSILRGTWLNLMTDAFDGTNKNCVVVRNQMTSWDGVPFYATAYYTKVTE